MRIGAIEIDSSICPNYPAINLAEMKDRRLAR